jgi:hypothetical protein
LGGQRESVPNDFKLKCFAKSLDLAWKWSPGANPRTRQTQEQETCLITNL